MQLGGKLNWDKDGFSEEEMVRERGFAKAELTYLLSRVMHTTTSVCLFVQSSVSAIPNASALRLAAVAAALSGQAAQALRLGGGNSLTARCLLGIVVLLPREGDPRSCHVSSSAENSKTHLPLRGSRPALTFASFDWSTCLPILPLLSTFAVRKHNRISLPSSIKEFIDGVYLY